MEPMGGSAPWSPNQAPPPGEAERTGYENSWCLRKTFWRKKTFQMNTNRESCFLGLTFRRMMRFEELFSFVSLSFIFRF